MSTQILIGDCRDVLKTLPDCARVNAGCRSCALRLIVRGPHFFASMRAGRLTPDYRQQLRTLGDEAAVHAEVRAAEATHRMDR